MDDAMILSCGHSYGSGGMQHIYRMVCQRILNPLIILKLLAIVPGSLECTFYFLNIGPNPVLISQDFP